MEFLPGCTVWLIVRPFKWHTVLYAEGKTLKVEGGDKDYPTVTIIKITDLRTSE